MHFIWCALWIPLFFQPFNSSNSDDYYSAFSGGYDPNKYSNDKIHNECIDLIFYLNAELDEPYTIYDRQTLFDSIR